MLNVSSEHSFKISFFYRTPPVTFWSDWSPLRIQPCYHTSCLTMLVVMFRCYYGNAYVTKRFSWLCFYEIQRFRYRCKINFATLSGIKNIWRREDNRWGSAHFKKTNFFKKKIKYSKIFKSVHRYYSQVYSQSTLINSFVSHYPSYKKFLIPYIFHILEISL